MNKLVVGLIMLTLTHIIISTINNPLLAAESQKAGSSASFLTYNDTAYGISIKYPSNWQIDESAHEYLLAILQNLTSESQMTNDSQNNAIKSKVSQILDAFGLESVSDVVGLSPDKKAEVFQKVSQEFKEGAAQVIVAFISPAEDESDVFGENLNIVIENISAASPISLNDYVNAGIENLKDGFQHLTIVQPPTEITIDGKPAMTVVYTGTSPLHASLTGKILQVFTIKGDSGYILTFTSTPETYSTYAPTFEKILQSFKITN
jgi:hypothetical protein